MNILIAIPAYNEGRIIHHTIASIKKHITNLPATILVVDDGSTDNTHEQALNLGVLVATHTINRGLGGALGTALEYAKFHHFDILVTLDADGQHDPTDIPKIIKPLLTNQADVVIGTRTRSRQGQMPLDRKIIITLSNLLTGLLFGQTTSDSQSGFRAFNTRAINSIHLKTERMEVSSEFFSEIRRLRLRLSEIPIKVIYTDYSRSKGQANTNAWNIFYKLILRLFR